MLKKHYSNTKSIKMYNLTENQEVKQYLQKKGECI